MSSAHQGAVLHQLGRLFGLGTVAGLSEWQLLSRYLNDRDEVAFEALVARHGPMVLGVCRRLLTDPNDVDDAFQATFLVLVRKANSLGERDAIGHWLYGVAYRVALRARSEAAQRRRREPNVATSPAAPESDAARFELGPVLDEELSRLPAKYRAPIVLCHLEGLSHEEAANQLQWPLGTVKGRLVRARELLKGRLVRRGLALSAGLSAASMSRVAVAVVPETLHASTVATAMKVASGPITAGVVSASVAALFEGVLATMFWNKLRTASAAALIVGFLAAGAGVVAQQSDGVGQDEPGPVVNSEPNRPAPKIEESATNDAATASSRDEPDARSSADRGAPLQEKAQRHLAALIFQDELKGYASGDPTGAKFNSLIRWSKEILNGADQATVERISAISDHLSRVRALRQVVIQLPPSPSNRGLLLQAEYYQQEATQMLARAKAGRDGSRPGSDAGINRADQDPKSLAILEKLETPISMSFGNETPLEDALKYIKSATTGDKDSGIPIYVDPLGLQKAEKTMQSPITLDLEGVPLKTTLALMLRPLGLGYRIKEGLLIITDLSPESQETPLSLLEEKAEHGELTPDETTKLIEMLKTINEIHKLKAEGRKLEQESKKSRQ